MKDFTFIKRLAKRRNPLGSINVMYYGTEGAVYLCKCNIPFPNETQSDDKGTYYCDQFTCSEDCL